MNKKGKYSQTHFFLLLAIWALLILLSFYSFAQNVKSEQNKDFAEHSKTTLSNYNKLASKAIGERHTVFATTDGIVYTFGYNAYGQLGNGNTISRDLPVKVASGSDFINDGNDKVIAVAAGCKHTIIATQSEKVYCFGYNQYGQLGNGSVTNRVILTKVSSGGGFTNGGDDKAIKVEAGCNYSVISTASGKLYVFGKNSEWENNNSTRYSVFPILQSSPKTKKIIKETESKKKKKKKN